MTTVLSPPHRGLATRASVGALVVLAVTAGCSFRSVGNSLAEGGLDYLRSPPAQDAVRQVADSSLDALSIAFKRTLRPTMDSTLRSFLESGAATAGRAEGTLAAALAGPIGDALQHLITRSLDSAGTAGRRQLNSLVHQASWDLDHELTPALGRSVAEATHSFMHELSLSVRTELRVAAESALAATVRSGVQAGGKAAEKSPVVRTVLWVALGMIGALVFLGIAWLVRERRRSLTTLSVLTEAIGQSHDPTLKGTIKAGAAQRHVEGWLHGFLEQHGQL